MRYENAIKVWGARRLEAAVSSYYWTPCDNTSIDVSTVDVKFAFDEGYACCGGSDPNCYCSFAESPSADVEITGMCLTCRKTILHTIDVTEFNFVTVLGEIVNAGNGTLTNE